MAKSTTAGNDVLRFHPFGGVTEAEDWVALAHAAQACADGRVYLERNSVVALHGVHDPAGARRELKQLSFAEHVEPAPVVVASPLSQAARAVAADVAAVGLAADTTVIGVDSGVGDIVAHGVAYGLVLDKDGQAARLIEAGSVGEEVLPIAEAIPSLSALLDVAAPGAPVQPGSVQSGLVQPGEEPARPIGWLAEHTPEGRVDLGAGLVGGVIPAEFAELMGRLAVPVTLTPWQGVVFHDIAEGDADVVLRVLAPRGFIFDVDSALL